MTTSRSETYFVVFLWIEPASLKGRGLFWLEAENQLLIEQFVTWAINAERKGVTLEMLNAPLPKPRRDRSKEVK
jgi:hypothetical protein